MTTRRRADGADLILGIGTGEREGNEPYGVDWSKPVSRFEEALATIRALNQMGIWVEIVTLLIPGFNDAEDEIDRQGREIEIVTKGRHDPCVGIRATPMRHPPRARLLLSPLVTTARRRCICAPPPPHRCAITTSNTAW